jgi:repressor LexA
MNDRESLSARQKQILDYIWQYSESAGRPPTIREIGTAVQISSTSVVNYNLIKLEEKGFLARDAEVSRGLRLTDKTNRLYGSVVAAVHGLVRVPMVGNIVASAPVEGPDSSPYDPDSDYVEIGTALLPGKSDDLFALRVDGLSMIDAMINDGDIVIMRKQETARNGDMVAVWLNLRSTTTLKYFYHEGDRVRLQPANPMFEPIYVPPDDVSIQGKVMFVLRQTA